MADNLYIIVATRDRPGLLKRTLDSISECLKPDIYRGTIIIENGSKSGVERIVSGYGDSNLFTYMFTDQGNKSHALNLALGEIDDGLVFFTDDDIRFHPELLNRYTDAAAGLASGEFYGGPIRTDMETTPPEWMMSSFPYSVRGLQTIEDWEFALGGNWAAFRADLVRCGLFDETRGPGTSRGGQETDMQERLKAAGVRFRFLQEATAWHFVPAERCTPRWLYKRHYRTGKGDARKAENYAGKWLGFKSWVWVEFAKRVRGVIGTLVGTDREQRFRSRLRVVYFLGLMHGFRHDDR